MHWLNIIEGYQTPTTKIGIIFLPAISCELIYSSVLNRIHVATIWNFNPNNSLPNVTQVSLPKMFQMVATWLQSAQKSS